MNVSQPACLPASQFNTPTQSNTSPHPSGLGMAGKGPRCRQQCVPHHACCAFQCYAVLCWLPQGPPHLPIGSPFAPCTPSGRSALRLISPSLLTRDLRDATDPEKELLRLMPLLSSTSAGGRATARRGSGCAPAAAAAGEGEWLEPATSTKTLHVEQAHEAAQWAASLLWRQRHACMLRGTACGMQTCCMAPGRAGTCHAIY